MDKKILIADKSITIRSIAESLLRQKEYEVSTAAEQDKALSSIRESPPDLIFLDYSLPGVSLSIFLQTLKSEPELKNVPVVLMFPISELKKQESLIQKENLSYLIKPFTPKELLVKTEEFIKESKAPTPAPSTAKRKSSIELMEEASSREVDAFFDNLIPDEGATDKMEKVSLPEEEEDLVLSTSFADTPPDEEEPEAVDKPHDYEWFLDEMKGEGKKPADKKKSASPPKTSAKAEKPAKKDEEIETKKLDVEVREMGTSKLKLDKILSKMKEKEEEEEEEPMSGYAQLKNEKEKAKEDSVKTSKLPLEAMLPTSKKEPSAKSAPPRETPPALDYYKMVDEIVEEVSDKLAKEIVKKIDKETVSKLLKEKIENLDFKIS